MTNFETSHACVKAEAGSVPAEPVDDLDGESRRDDSSDSIFSEESFREEILEGPQNSAELGDALPEGTPDYGDLLDVDWLERGADGMELEGDVVDIGLTLDLADRDEPEDVGLAIEFDVGSLLTVLPSEVLPSEVLPSEVPSEAGLRDGSWGTSTLKDLLLPEETLELGLDRGDEEVGDDERFPALDAAELVPTPPHEDEDVARGGELD